MTTTSQKLRKFESEPINEKLITELPGVGPKYAERLRSIGFEYAYEVLGQFLILKKNEEDFKVWFNELCETKSPKHADDLYRALKSWTDTYI